MENESSLEMNENIIQNSSQIFKLDFPGQNIKGNSQFNEFKKQKLNEFGNDAKLFKCKYDNLYFYVSKNNCKTFPFYFKECPLCHKQICYFCSGTIYSQNTDNGNCCVRRKLYYLFFHNGFAYFNLDNVAEINREDYKIFFILSLIPLLGTFFLIIFTSGYFFFVLEIKDIKRKNDVNVLQNYRTYADYLNQYYSSCLIITIYVFTYIILTVCFALYDIYFKIILVFISLFSKFYPFKYLIGIMIFGLNLQYD